MDNMHRNTCLLNKSYKSLLTTGRTYAAFSDAKSDEWNANKCARHLAYEGISEVLDPMSGYGTIMKYGSTYGFSTYNVELNLPAYYWQLIVSGIYSNEISQTINDFVKRNEQRTTNEKTFEVSESLIGPRGLSIAVGLYERLLECAQRHVDKLLSCQDIALAVLLPFVFRLSTAIRGDTAHIKVAGIATLKDYKSNFEYYLLQLLSPIVKTKDSCVEQMKIEDFKPLNSCFYGDARVFPFPKASFRGLLTSPPYPNGTDYKKLFLVENYFINWLVDNKYLNLAIINTDTIGTNVVKNKLAGPIKSNAANEFINKMNKLKLSKQARNAMERYYLPYWKNYFFDIEAAYENISTALTEDFLGYIEVTNNAARKIEIPVSEFLIEVWRNMGFNARCIKDKEISHMGSKNPHAKGRMARHTGHIIKVWGNRDEQ